ncbi:MAG: branched-chain amino acid ABC transporter substrate-binding protein [Desulfobacterales bacterium]|nr:branched-chain amino acid ABC transporter substrate-binding protein [Desulfobacterales bacterium]
MNRNLIMVLTCVFVITFAFGIQAKAMDKDVTLRPGEPVHIAYWVVISGPNTSLGTDVVRGIEIAMDDFGGQVKGFPIKLSGQDAGCSAEGGQAAATKLAADPTIVAAIGSTCSSAAKPGVPILWKAGIPSVSPSNTAPFLTDPNRGEGYGGYARTCHNDKIQGAIAAEFAFKQKGLKKAATIHDGSVYAEQLAQVFAATFKKLGGTVTSMEAISPNDTDMRPVLTKIATGKPDIIYYPIFIAEGGFITRQSKEISGLEKTVLFGADGMFSPDFYKAAGMSAVGMYHSSPDFAAFAGGYQTFLKTHMKKYGEKPIAPFHGHAYDATMMILKAIDKAAVKKGGNLVINRKAVRDALLATSNMQGLTGMINCDQYGDCADPKIAIYQTAKENVKELKMPEKPYWKPY